MGVGPGRNDGEASVMDVGLGCMPESDSLFSLRYRANDTHANIIHDLLFNLNYDSRREVIIKLVSNSKIQRSIEEVLHSVPIEQSTYNKSLVNWKDCTQPYAVDHVLFGTIRVGGAKVVLVIQIPKSARTQKKWQYLVERRRLSTL
jgi:hypothetical protein